MGKLLSLQEQIQNTVDSTISKAEEFYLSVADKSADATDKLYDQHKELIAKMFSSLKDLNTKSGEAVAAIIAKVEKEPTTEEKVKDAVDKAADVTKSVVEKTAEKVSKMADKVEKVKEEALA